MTHEHEEYFKLDFLEKQISKEEDFETVSKVFSLLSDSSRLKIFWLLSHSKECVVNLSEILKMTTPAVSHHLKILKDSGLIENYRDGKEVFYTASKSSESQALHSIIEKLMSISCPDFDACHEKINENSEYLEDQVSKIKEIHEYLTQNLEKRITIETIAKHFAMNPTTIKTVFKDVYGTSLAAHIKQHRMEKSAELLISTDYSISQIAVQTGYESQSKFSAVFKEFFKQTPVEYRKSRKN